MRQHSSASRLRLQAAGQHGKKGLTPQALLGLHPFFSALAPGDVLKFLVHTHCRSVASGRTIFRKDDPGDGLYGVLAGNVAFTIGSRDGKDLTLNVLGPGEFFGEIALLDGGGRSATALTRSACRLLFVPRREFLSFFAERPEAMMQIIALLCARLRRSTDYIADSTFLGFSPRLAKQLIVMLDECGVGARCGATYFADGAGLDAWCLARARESATGGLGQQRYSGSGPGASGCT